MTSRVLFLPSQQPPRKTPKLPAPRADVSTKGRARHRGFILLSRRGAQNRQILPIWACSTFAASSFPRCRSCQYEHFPPTLPHGGAVSVFQASGGYAPGCARKTGHSRDTRLTRADRRFPAAPVGTLPTAFGCVPARIPRPALQPFARKTVGWRTEWAGVCTKGFRSACVRPA